MLAPLALIMNAESLGGANTGISWELLNPPCLTCILNGKHIQLKCELEIGGANSRCNYLGEFLNTPRLKYILSGKHLLFR